MSGTELVPNAAADPLRIVLVAPPYFDIPDERHPARSGKSNAFSGQVGVHAGARIRI